MHFIRITKWEEYQHYKDRDPLWIKLHRGLLSSEVWIMTSDASRSLAIGIMLIAAEKSNKVPFNLEYIRKRASLNSEPDFSELIRYGFIEIVDENERVVSLEQNASDLIAECSLERETYREEKDTPLPPSRIAFDQFNTMAKRAGLSVAQAFTKPRERAIDARLRECGGIDGWAAMLEIVERTPYLCGENDRGWRADLDFVTKQSKFTKIMEGGYGRSDKSTGNRDGFRNGFFAVALGEDSLESDGGAIPG